MVIPHFIPEGAQGDERLAQGHTAKKGMSQDSPQLPNPSRQDCTCQEILAHPPSVNTANFRVCKGLSRLSHLLFTGWLQIVLVAVLTVEKLQLAARKPWSCNEPSCLMPDRQGPTDASPVNASPPLPCPVPSPTCATWLCLS